MNSLLLFLLLGASVTLAELPFDHPALVGFLNEEGEELFGAELADEENDPDNELRKCKEEMSDCLEVNKDYCKKLLCLGEFDKCKKSLVPPPSDERLQRCLKGTKRCFSRARGRCNWRFSCQIALRDCLRYRPRRKL